MSGIRPLERFGWEMYLRGVNEGPLISVEQHVTPEPASPLDEVVPAVPHEVGSPVAQEGENHGPLVQRAVRSRDIAQGASLRAAAAAATTGRSTV